MKIVKTLLLVVAVVCFCACGGSSYNPKTSEKLFEKIHSGEKLTDADYSEMIDQLGAGCKIMIEKQKEIGDDKAKAEEFANDKENRDMVTSIMGFAFYLDAHKGELSPDNLKKFEKLEKELSDLK